MLGIQGRRQREKTGRALLWGGVGPRFGGGAGGRGRRALSSVEKALRSVSFPWGGPICLSLFCVPLLPFFSQKRGPCVAPFLSPGGAFPPSLRCNQGAHRANTHTCHAGRRRFVSWGGIGQSMVGCLWPRGARHGYFCLFVIRRYVFIYISCVVCVDLCVYVSHRTNSVRRATHTT